MPGFDRTGPAGMGPMTGGGRGLCNPYSVGTARFAPVRPFYPLSARPAYGYGFWRPRWGLMRNWGMGGGRGRGRGRW